jgi:biopolymer transport protein TolQ
MTTDLSFIQLILNASLVVQLVLLSLVAASILSWYVIFRKWKITRTALHAATKFEKEFWSGKELSQLYRKITAAHDEAVGMSAIFEAGFREYAHLHKEKGIKHSAVLEGTQRCMRVAQSREMESLEKNLPFLATVASTSPYVGLFGTVWGIMNSFRALGQVNQATLNMVAPGIAEALIATAMGLFAAIPAVIAYNRYVTDVDRLAGRYDTFMEEFSSILQRESYKNDGE